MACGTCKFYDPQDSAVGLCRVNRPDVILDDDGDLVSIWPTVEKTDWCGQWEREQPMEQHRA